MAQVKLLTKENYDDYIYGRTTNNVIFYGSDKCNKCINYQFEYNRFVEAVDYKNVNFYYFNTKHINHNNDLYQTNLLTQSCISFLKGTIYKFNIINSQITKEYFLETLQNLILDKYIKRINNDKKINNVNNSAHILEKMKNVNNNNNYKNEYLNSKIKNNII